MTKPAITIEHASRQVRIMTSVHATCRTDSTRRELTMWTNILNELLAKQVAK